MPVPSKITDLSPNEALNSPLGTENVGSPGSVDNYFRSIQAIFRTDSLMKSWEVRSDVPTYISGTSFSIPGDQTLWYKVPRRVQARVAGGSIFGSIATSTFNGVITTVTITPDAGVLDVSLSAVWLGVDQQAIGMSSANVISALGYTPVNKAGDTMGGQLLQPLAPSTPSALVNKLYVDNLIATSVTPGVTSFNTRTGAVTLTKPDVTTALAYTPANIAGDNFTGHVNGTTAVFSGGMRSLYYAPYLFIAGGLSGSIPLSMFNGQEQTLGLAGATTFTSIDNMVGGAIMRLLLNGTQHAIAWPANVYWPMGVTPDLTVAPNHVALVTIHYAGSGSGSGISQGGTLVGQALLY